MSGLRTAAIALVFIAAGGAAGAGVVDLQGSALPLPAESLTLLCGIAGLGILRRRGRA